MEKFYSGGFLYNPQTKKVFLHHRDAQAAINPNKWAFFGGLSEGDESPSQAFARELHEEIGLLAKESDVVLLREYHNKELNTYRFVFYLEFFDENHQFILGEGDGFQWIPIQDLSRYDLTDKTKEDLEYFLQMLDNAR